MFRASTSCWSCGGGGFYAAVSPPHLRDVPIGVGTLHWSCRGRRSGRSGAQLVACPSGRRVSSSPPIRSSCRRSSMLAPLLEPHGEGRRGALRGRKKSGMRPRTDPNQCRRRCRGGLNGGAATLRAPRRRSCSGTPGTLVVMTECNEPMTPSGRQVQRCAQVRVAAYKLEFMWRTQSRLILTGPAPKLHRARDSSSCGRPSLRRQIGGGVPLKRGQS